MADRLNSFWTDQPGDYNSERYKHVYNCIDGQHQTNDPATPLSVPCRSRCPEAGYRAIEEGVSGIRTLTDRTPTDLEALARSNALHDALHLGTLVKARTRHQLPMVEYRLRECVSLRGLSQFGGETEGLHDG